MPLLPVAIQTSPGYTPAFNGFRVTPNPVTLTSSVTTQALTVVPVDQRGAAFSLPASATGSRLSMPSGGWLASSVNGVQVSSLAGTMAMKLRVGLAAGLAGLSSGNNWGFVEVDSDGLGTGTNVKFRLFAAMVSATTYAINFRVGAASIFTPTATIASVPAGESALYVDFDNVGSLTQHINLFDTSGNLYNSVAGPTPGNMPTTGSPGYVVVGKAALSSPVLPAAIYGGFSMYSATLPLTQQFTPPLSSIAGQNYADLMPVDSIVAMALMRDGSGNNVTLGPGGVSGILSPGSGTMGWTTGGTWTGAPGGIGMAAGTPIQYNTQTPAVCTVSAGTITRVGVGTGTVNVWVGNVVQPVTVNVTS